MRDCGSGRAVFGEGSVLDSPMSLFEPVEKKPAFVVSLLEVVMEEVGGETVVAIIRHDKFSIRLCCMVSAEFDDLFFLHTSKISSIVSA